MAIKDNLPTPYTTLAEAEVLNADMELWIHKTDDQKNEALGWARVYLDSNYSHSFDSSIAVADVPLDVKLANATLANYHFTQSLFLRQTTDPNPLAEVEVKAGSVTSRKRYIGNTNWVDPFPDITQLIAGTSRLTSRSSDSPVARA